MEVTGLSETIDAIQAELNKIRKRAEAAVRLAGQAYANDVKALAPLGQDPKTGPHGTYRRSIHVEAIIEEDGKYYAIVGTDLPQARRLEWGFYDMVDSLGRHYYQLPLPHFRPPLDTEMDRYVAIMQGAFDDAAYDREAGKNWAADQMSDIRPDLMAGVLGLRTGGNHLTEGISLSQTSKHSRSSSSDSMEPVSVMMKVGGMIEYD